MPVAIPKVAIVHDDLVQWGGAERVLLAIAELYPEAPIYTSLFNQDNQLLRDKFQGKKIVTSFLQKIPGQVSIYKNLLPLYPLAFEQFDFSEFDLVISQTTRFAKAIITKPSTLHICYCHTPPRFIWNYHDQIQGALFPYLSFLRFFDQITSRRPDVFIAGSKNAQSRIFKEYRQSSQVILPFVDLQRFLEVEPFTGGYYLVISRLVSYKRVDLAIQAARLMGRRLKIVGTGPELKRLQDLAGPEVEFLGTVSDNSLSWVIAGCQALLVPGEEDFGMTPLEANALGKPVIAFGRGGALETVLPTQTGYLFGEQSVSALRKSISQLETRGYNRKKCLEWSAQFSKEVFKQQFAEFVKDCFKDVTVA